MTMEEARRVASVLALADGGCSHCVSDLVARMQTLFPEFDWKGIVAGYDAFGPIA